MSAPDSGTAVVGGEGKRKYVRQMFSEIAPRYDLLNHLLSLNIDKLWRRAAVSRLLDGRPGGGRYLDLCAGTLDLADELRRRTGPEGSVIGADFVLPMLRLGREKVPAIVAVGADALSLPFSDGHFDGVIVGFGVRNLEDLDAGLAEMARVVKPGGTVVVLEFCTPVRWPIRAAYLAYFKFVLPAIGRLVSKHKTAYSYLPESVLGFPSPEQLQERLTRAGFEDAGFRRLTFGIVAINWGTKS